MKPTPENARAEPRFATVPPIQMTSVAFILGCVPLWKATGSGAIARNILGTTVIGGMLAAGFLAIFIIPGVLVERLLKEVSDSDAGGKRAVASMLGFPLGIDDAMPSTARWQNVNGILALALRRGKVRREKTACTCAEQSRIRGALISLTS